MRILRILRSLHPQTLSLVATIAAALQQPLQRIAPQYPRIYYQRSYAVHLRPATRDGRGWLRNTFHQASRRTAGVQAQAIFWGSRVRSCHWTPGPVSEAHVHEWKLWDDLLEGKWASALPPACMCGKQQLQLQLRQQLALHTLSRRHLRCHEAGMKLSTRDDRLQVSRHQFAP